MQNLISKRGQGLVEYILIVVLMGIATLTLVKALGTHTKAGFTKASNALQQEFGG